MFLFVQTFAKIANDLAAGVALSYLIHLLGQEGSEHYVAIGQSEWENQCFLSRREVSRVFQFWASLEVVKVELVRNRRLYSLNVLVLESLLQPHLTKTVRSPLPLKIRAIEQETTARAFAVDQKDNPGEVPTFMNASEILNKMLAKRGQVSNNDPPALHWVKGQASHGKYIKPLTRVEQAQLKAPLKHLEDNAEYLRGMHWALNNWGAFMHAVKLAAGLTTAPDSPHPGFFAKYHAIAMSQSKKAVVDMPKPTQAHSSAPAPAAPVDIAGIDELLDLLK